MPETLLSQSTVKLYGRVLDGVDLKWKSASFTTGKGDNGLLSKQLKYPGSDAPGLARIYAFSFEGSFYNLPRPAIFLVHGKGSAVSYGVAASHGPSPMDETGMVARDV